MKTHYLINYHLTEYTKHEIDVFRAKINNKLPAMDRVVGTVIMNKTVPFQITQIQVNLDSDEKMVIITQMKSRTILSTANN